MSVKKRNGGKMKDIAYAKVKSFVEKKNSGLKFIQPTNPYKYSHWLHSYGLSGFSDTYKVGNSIRHRRKYFMHYDKEGNIKSLETCLNNIQEQEAERNFNYKIEIVKNQYHVIRITTYYDTEA